MTLDELQELLIPLNEHLSRRALLNDQGMLIDVWFNVGNRTWDIYLHPGSRVEQLWADLGPLEAQAVIFHLSGDGKLRPRWVGR